MREWISFDGWFFIHKARLGLLQNNFWDHLFYEEKSNLCRKCKEELETLMHILNHCRYSLNFANAKHDKIKDELAKYIDKYFGRNTVTTEKIHYLPNGFHKRMDIFVNLGTTTWIVEVKSPWDRDTPFDNAHTRAIVHYREVQQDLLDRHNKTTVKIYPFVVGCLGRWHDCNNIGWNEDKLLTYKTRVAKHNIEICSKHYNRHLMFYTEEQIIQDGTT